MYIRERGKISYLTGATPTPDSKDPMYEIWDVENSMVMTWLVNSMEEEINPNYMCFSTAKELWDEVTTMYSDLGNQSQIYELNLKLSEIRQDSDTVTTYFNSLKRIWQDLDLFNTYVWKSPDDCKHYQQMVDANRVFKFLIGLNVEFDEVRGRIIGRNPLLSLSEAFSKVWCEESRRLVMLGKKNNGANGLSENMTLVVDANTSGRHIPGQRKVEEKPRVWCDHSNKPCHTRETCWVLYEKPTNWKLRQKRSQPTANGVEAGTFNKEQIDQLLRLLNPNLSLGIPNCNAYSSRNSFTLSSSFKSVP